MKRRRGRENIKLISISTPSVCCRGVAYTSNEPNDDDDDNDDNNEPTTKQPSSYNKRSSVCLSNAANRKAKQIANVHKDQRQRLLLFCNRDPFGLTETNCNSDSNQTIAIAIKSGEANCKTETQTRERFLAIELARVSRLRSLRVPV